MPLKVTEFIAISVIRKVWHHHADVDEEFENIGNVEDIDDVEFENIGNANIRDEMFEMEVDLENIMD